MGIWIGCPLRPHSGDSVGACKAPRVIIFLLAFPSTWYMRRNFNFPVTSAVKTATRDQRWRNRPRRYHRLWDWARFNIGDHCGIRTHEFERVTNPFLEGIPSALLRLNTLSGVGTNLPDMHGISVAVSIVTLCASWLFCAGVYSYALRRRADRGGVSVIPTQCERVESFGLCFLALVA